MSDTTTNDQPQQTPQAITSAADLLAAYAAGRRDFRGAYLRGAYLRGADLRDAYLSGADLRDADLRGAYLRGADLRDAYLSGADLRDAYLRDAYLRDAYLRDADLSGAYLRGAYLRGADLSGAYLRDADLTMADTSASRDDLYAALAYAPHEVPALLATLEAGKINGSTYNGGDCACLAGTIARLTDDPQLGVLFDGYVLDCGLVLDADSPRERWFLAIQPGDTPENSPVAALTATWLRDWLAAHPEATTPASE